MVQIYQHVLSLAFAIQEINKNTQIIPNVTLGFRIYNSYFIPSWTYHASLEMLSAKGKFMPNYNCDTVNNLMAVIGGPNPQVIRHMATILCIFKLPQVKFVPVEWVFKIYSHVSFFPLWFKNERS